MKFLIITKEYTTSSDANARIVESIAKELHKRNHEIEVIAKENQFHRFSHEEDGMMVYRVNHTLWDKINIYYNNNLNDKKTKFLFYLLKFLRDLFLTLFFIYPNSEPILTKRYITFYKENLYEKKYDFIICFFRPCLCLDVGCNIKKRNSSIGFVSYYLDAIEDKTKPKFMPQLYHRYNSNKSEEKIYRLSDYIFLPVSLKNRLNDMQNLFAQKISYLEFPSFGNKINSEKCKNNSDTWFFLYAGTLKKSFRSPKKTLILLATLATLNKNKKIILKIYGGGDCFDIIQNFVCPDNMTIMNCGLVPKGIVEDEMKRADFLINITNDLKTLVPSKIFELFSKCKPIINVISNKDDGSMQYFEKYPICFNASWEKELPKKIICEFNAFVCKNINSVIDYEKVKTIYKANTIENVVTNLLYYISVKK